MDSSWILVEAKSDAPTKANPRASVGYGRIELNRAACELVPNLNSYNFARLFLNADNSEVGILFDVDRTDQSIPITRKKQKGGKEGAVTISSKAHVAEAFGDIGVAKKTSHGRVRLAESDDRLFVLRMEP